MENALAPKPNLNIVVCCVNIQLRDMVRRIRNSQILGNNDLISRFLFYFVVYVVYVYVQCKTLIRPTSRPRSLSLYVPVIEYMCSIFRKWKRKMSNKERETKRKHDSLQHFN